ncbi:hypothetical protein N7463_002002 [Penicillium fimorum]|uniref:Major facilitator superfamily (MFS) profile domain-containing protein n=1 Tax=Penicillium fimorum TaxID=1882269 RepID=A0A9X0C8K1_9EURO|nr:hypothetical protein N7463_002002 [Penicillium fimorum]
MFPLPDPKKRVSGRKWGSRWRSSDTFILSSMSMALFTDEMLFAFMVPLLPHIFENRLGLDTALTQRLTSIFLVEGALISIVSSPFIGNLADRATSKKFLLLVILVLTLISVLCLSITTSLTWLFIGRFFQCIVSNALFIVGMATMAENIGSEHMGKIAGLTSTLVSAGTCSGPIIAGFLFGIGGYWTAWAGGALFLVVDIIMRLLMIEKPQKRRDTTCQSRDKSLCTEDHGYSSDTEPLLDGDRPSTTEEIGGWRFYACLFRQPRFTAGILSYFVFALFIASFESTIAMHVRYAFDWGVFPVGLLFASIQGPGMILAPFVGLLKDHVGSRVPTTIGFIAIAPFLLVLGVAGDERFPWATVGARGPILAGFMVERFGYLDLQCVLAVTSLLVSINAAFNLSSASPQKKECDGDSGTDAP